MCRRRPRLAVDPDAFPVEPPADLIGAAAIAAHDWAAFSALRTVTDYWSRPQWPDGARAFYWMLAFDGEPELTALAARCQEALAPLVLDPVPARDGLHLTLARLGAVGAVGARQLDACAGVPASALPEAFRVRVLPLAGSRGAVRCSVAPWEPLIRLHAALTRVTARAGLRELKPTASFRPHLSVAYHNQAGPAAPVIEAVGSLRGLAPVDVAVSRVQLVELRRRGRRYEWDVLRSLPLR